MSGLHQNVLKTTTFSLKYDLSRLWKQSADVKAAVPTLTLRWSLVSTSAGFHPLSALSVSSRSLKTEKHTNTISINNHPGSLLIHNHCLTSQEEHPLEQLIRFITAHINTVIRWLVISPFIDRALHRFCLLFCPGPNIFCPVNKKPSSFKCEHKFLNVDLTNQHFQTNVTQVLFIKSQFVCVRWFASIKDSCSRFFIWQPIHQWMDGWMDDRPSIHRC